MTVYRCLPFVRTIPGLTCSGFGVALSSSMLGGWYLHIHWGVGGVCVASRGKHLS